MLDRSTQGLDRSGFGFLDRSGLGLAAERASLGASAGPDPRKEKEKDKDREVVGRQSSIPRAAANAAGRSALSRSRNYKTG